MFDLGCFLLDLRVGVADILFGELDLESLEFLFLLKKCKLTVVSHVVDLFVISCDLLASGLDIGRLVGDQFAQRYDLILKFLDSRLVAHNLVLTVFDLIGELAAQYLDAVYLRQECLKLIECLESLFNAAFFLVFLFCHVSNYVLSARL